MTALERDYSEIDRHFAAFICRLAGTAAEELHRAALLVSQAVGQGHVCVDLTTAGPDGWWHGLAEFPVVGSPGAFTPLVLDGAGRLYLHRYWRYEHDLAAAVLHKGGQQVPLDEALLREGLDRLFPDTIPGEVDWQRVAAMAAVRSGFAVISGGPGTGKTSTVVKILALLLEQAAGRPLAIALAAPTGKAAVRLQESIRTARERLNVAPEVRERIPAEVVTLHRLLGAGGSGRFRHDRENPLPHDLVVVDEASMVALPLMARLVTALKPRCRLILLGDRDQLASVEAGAVLGDICDTGRGHSFSPTFGSLVTRVAAMELPATGAEPLADSLVILRKSHRFAPDSGIAVASRLISAGEGAEALTVIRGDSFGELVWRDAPAPQALPEAFGPLVMAGFAPYLRAGSPLEALALFDRFRILCAVRRGPYGVEEVNRLVEAVLARAGLIDTRERWYRGRPVMVTANDYQLRLFNGDIGIVIPDPDGTPKVHFPSPDGGVRQLSPLRLPPHETVYAMTVHKSQGSEFTKVLMLLPYADTEICTRELIYTAMTRAREAVELWGNESGFLAAVSRRVERRSGLREALWGIS
ncbi:exodeoxyribonuclease V subunit alpha [Geobacter argillaceus]|uniref:DNA helicase/exodeoxyribonuclease V alpha subunit n=1 Tax=Geobacter argillaceus TaxID=345631 RepID=A0A562VLA3_9BACT|nr:exodeoxyribonuclease V subunit alpha [Geobacter argillaceus]TWJ18746.1 DNA helicase/exodeoxyribonuclease V alpha subunit [Geobacter argillaceus]